MPKQKQLTVPQLLEKLGEVRSQKQEAYEYAGSLASREGELKLQVQETLSALGLKTAKTQDGRFTAGITTRPTLKVIDETAAIKWLKAEKLDVELYTGLKTVMFKSLAEAKLKETGEIVPGTQQETVEYLSFRENKPKETGAKNASKN